MKIVILFNESIHYGLASANRVLNYGQGLSYCDCNVKIWMPSVYVKDDTFIFPSKGQYNGVAYEYLKHLNYNPFIKHSYLYSIFISLTLHWSAYFKFLRYFIVKQNEYDVLYVYKFDFFFTLLILLFNRNKIVVSELCEIPYHNSNIKFRRIKRFLREKILLNKFSGFVAISESLLKYAEKHKNKRSEVIKIPILISEHAFVKSTKPHFVTFSDSYILHTGSLSESKDGIIGMIEAFGDAYPFLDKKVKYIFTGNIEHSPDKEMVYAKVKDKKLSDAIIFGGFVSKPELKWLQENCSLAIINKAENEQNTYNFPTKLGEYLINSIPVIATKVGEMNLYLKDGENACIVPPNDVKALSMAIISMLNNENTKKVIGVNGHKTAIMEFSAEKNGIKMKQFFELLIKKLSIVK